MKDTELIGNSLDWKPSGWNIRLATDVEEAFGRRISGMFKCALFMNLNFVMLLFASEIIRKRTTWSPKTGPIREDNLSDVWFVS